MFNAFVLSNLNYCPLVWHMCGVTDAKKVEKIQERALRFVFNDTSATYRELLCKAKKEVLYKQRVRQMLLEVYKVVNNTGPCFLNEVFNVKDIVYNLRNEIPLLIPSFKTKTYGYNSIRYQGAKVWNQLPGHIQNVNTYNEFRSLVMAWAGPSCKCNECLLCI